GLVGGYQGIARAIAHVSLRRELWLLAPAMGHLGHVLPVVGARRIESGRNHGHEELHATQGHLRRRPRVRLERAARDFGDGVAFDDAIGAPVARLKPAPSHGRCSLRKTPTSRLNPYGHPK